MVLLSRAYFGSVGSDSLVSFMIRPGLYTGNYLLFFSKKQVLWYWTKYLLLVSVLPLIFGLFALTRYLPESPKFILDKFPEGKITFRNKQLSTTIPEPYKVGNQDFIFVIDTNGNEKELDNFNAGILFSKDKAFIKSQDNQFESQDYAKIPDFSLNKTQLSSWVSQHLFNLWLGGLAAIIIFGTITFGLSWLFRMAIYALWALVFWLIGKHLLKKTLTYVHSLNIVLYASVIQLLLSLFMILVPNQILDILGTVLFVYFAFAWLRNLPVTVSSAASSSQPLLTGSKTHRKPRKKTIG